MTKFYHPMIGDLYIGNKVKFNYPTGVKIGKITKINEDNKGVYVDIYCVDDTGGYTLTIPQFSISEILSEKEDIKKPKRYNKRGNLECWDVIIDQEMNFLEGSVLKYLWRYKEKNGIHDLEKAKVYIDKIIEGLKSESN